MAKNTRRILWMAALLVLCASLVLLILVNVPRSQPVIETTIIVPTVLAP